MRPMLTTEPPARDFNVDELAGDCVLSVCPLMATATLGILISGIEYAAFFLPMIVLTPIACTWLGVCRGNGDANLWLKAVCLSLAPIFLVFLDNARLVPVAAALTIPFAAVGMWLRRRGWL
jgi:hypothetical protein